MTMEEIRVAAIQMPVTYSKEENLSKAETLLNRAASKGAQMACLPEYFLFDCPEKDMTKDEIQETAESIPGPTTDLLGTIAKRLNMIICSGSFLERTSDGLLQNSSALIGADGKIMGTYQKTHPENAPPKYEVGAGVKPGDDYPVFETELGKIGIIIDMDATTAEAARIEYIRGAEIILWPLKTGWVQEIPDTALSSIMAEVKSTTRKG
jgi:N-carbamoylputrescine amidase